MVRPAQLEAKKYALWYTGGSRDPLSHEHNVQRFMKWLYGRIFSVCE